MKTIIHTPTNKLKDSVDFYSKLQFKSLAGKPILFSDGIAVIEVNPDRFARSGLKLFKASWAEEVSALKAITAVTEMPGGYLFSDPGGVWIYLVESEPVIKFKKTDNSFSVLGNFAGLSLETADIARAVRIFEILGFEKNNGSEEQGWISFVNGEDFKINIMKPLCCPHLFFNPSLTYFNGKNNLSVIEKIRSLEITITEEITHFNKNGTADNIIIRDPGGYGFFIFND